MNQTVAVGPSSGTCLAEGNVIQPAFHDEPIQKFNSVVLRTLRQLHLVMPQFLDFPYVRTVVPTGPSHQGMERLPAECCSGHFLQLVQRKIGRSLEPFCQPFPQPLRGLLSRELQIKGIPVIFLIDQEYFVQFPVHIVSKVVFLLIQVHALLIQCCRFRELFQIRHRFPKTPLYNHPAQNIFRKFLHSESPSNPSLSN